MKRSALTIVPVVFLLCALSCKEECCPEEVPASDQQLNGSWLLYERGYSPGSGYIIEHVSPEPEQRITFRAGNRMTSTVKGMSQFKFYSTIEDSLSDDRIIQFYIDVPQSPDIKAPSYTVRITDGKLKLHYRFCIEGCHLGFRRINNH